MGPQRPVWTHASKAWVAELEVGDQVYAVRSTSYGRRVTPKLLTVTRTTKTRVMLDDGRAVVRVGPSAGEFVGTTTDRFWSHWVEKYTPDVQATWDKEARYANARATAQRLIQDHFKELPVEALEQIVTIITEARDATT